MLTTTKETLREASQLLQLDAGRLAKFCRPNAIWERNLKVGKNNFPAFRVWHNNYFGPYKGGIRFHPETCASEVQALATLMSLKTAAVGLPLGGAKGGVACQPEKLSPSTLEAIARTYVREFYDYLGPQKDIPAPDVNTNAQIMDWMADEYANLSGDRSGAVFSGKSVNKGGSLGREAATGRGGLLVLSQVLSLSGQTKPLKVAVQGFGNVGSHFADLCQYYPHWEITAIADHSGTFSHKKGLPLDKLLAWRANNPGVALEKADFNLERQPREAILELPVDVLVLAALGDAITEKNMTQIKAKYLVELANGPINTEATLYLEKQGSFIIPSILASSGGVIVSYFEYCQNLALSSWPQEHVNHQLRVILSAATQDIWQFAKQWRLNLRQGAYAFSLQQFIAPPKPFVSPLKSRLHFWSGSRNASLVRQASVNGGLDLTRLVGAKVQAVAPGKVVFSGPDKDQGNLVVVEHRFGLQTYYAHLGQTLVKTGDLVTAKQELGKIGRNKWRQKPYLHLEVHRHYQPVDPLPYLSKA